MTLRQRSLVAARRYTAARPPDFVVGAAASPQVERWWLIPRNGLFNVYLHRFNRSDEGRALHDHMYVNLSWILGPAGYWEMLFDGQPVNGNKLPSTRLRWRRAGSLTPRLPSTAHRIVLPNPESVYSLFITGPRVRRWGFWCPRGWRHWKEFLAENPSIVGKGCE